MGIRPAAPGDVPRLAEVLTQAFFNDPVTVWHLPDDEPRLDIMRRFFALGLAEEFVPQGSALTTDELDAVCVWVSPRARESSAEPEVDLPFADIFGPYAERSEAVVRLLEQNQPQEPAHYSLPFMGTIPERQGHGIGAAFLRMVLGQCDRERIPAYLAASSAGSKALYVWHGFDVAGELPLPGGPSFWQMWYRPTRVSSIS
jgi:GNAT superfamily N-acetyltransferase